MNVVGHCFLCFSDLWKSKEVVADVALCESEKNREKTEKNREKKYSQLMNRSFQYLQINSFKIRMHNYYKIILTIDTAIF